jgi:exopolysaccharide production protein ExoZ
LPSLQVLRAFAAIAVVEAHTAVSFGGWHSVGTFGVDIFFVLSGFIMAMICQQERESFLTRRLTRIVPPYWALTLLSYVVLLAIPSLDRTSPRGAQALLKSLFFIPYSRTDGKMLPVLGPGWTLNYEMCFYILLTFALFLWRKHASRLVILLLILVMSGAHFATTGIWSMFYGNGIMCEFVAGIIAFHIYSEAKPNLCVRLRALLYASGVASICLLVWYEGTLFYNAGGNRLWFGLSAYVLVQSVVLLARSGREMHNRLLILIGDCSYTLYLFHPLVISILHHIVSRTLPALQTNHPLGSIVAILVSVACAVPIYVFVEMPIHRKLNTFLLHDRCFRGHWGTSGSFGQM